MLVFREPPDERGANALIWRGTRLETEMANSGSREDTVTQKVGRVLIILSGNLIVVLSSMAIRGAKEQAGTPAWWRTVLSAAFDPKGMGKVTWPLLALFVLGNVLNVVGLWPEIKQSRYSIGGLMLAVIAVAVGCACLRYWPLTGLVLILVASLSPAVVNKWARRGRPAGGRGDGSATAVKAEGARTGAVRGRPL